MLRLVTFAVILFMLAPLLAVVATAFGKDPYPTFPPSGFSLRWFEAAFASKDLWNATKVSVQVAAATTSLATLLGTASAIGIRRSPSSVAGAAELFLLSPILFPGIVLGLAVMVAFYWVGLAQTLAGLIIAHTIIALPFVVRMVLSSYAAVSRNVEDAAYSLGASATRTLFSVTLPLLRAGIVSGAAFAFIISFDELVLTLFLAGPGLTTLPMRMYSFIEYANEPTISAVATILIVAWIAVGIPLYHWVNRKSSKQQVR